MQPTAIAIDWGTSVIGILDLTTKQYTAYRTKQMEEAARLIVNHPGDIVSFSRTDRDLKEIATILNTTFEELILKGQDFNMASRVSAVRWPPEPGKKPIFGTDLTSNFRHFYGDAPLVPPANLTDEYIIDNWQDCYMVGKLYLSWQRGELKAD